MKPIFTTLFLLSFFTSFSQVPQGIPYQSAMRNSSGGILANQNVSIRFSVHDSSITGTIVYQETHEPTTNSQGIVSLTIGQGTATIGILANINWAQHAKFLQVEMDPAGGTNYVDLGTQQMMSVPYAMYAGTSGNALIGPTGPQGPIGPQGPVGNFPNGNIIGEMLYWNGITWVNIPNGIQGLQGTQAQILKLCNGIPTWGNCQAGLPILTTTAISNNFYIISGGGTISNDGGDSIIARGICWSTSPNPIVAMSTKTINGSGFGSFNSSITGLNANTTYYVRAYATNNVGTGYGQEVSFVSEAVGIEQSYQGGMIAYILQPGDIGYNASLPHGLIVATTDQSAKWSNSYSVTGAIGTALGSGNTNTNIIVAAIGNGSYAAKICYDLVLNGYSDWYLPSIDELVKINIYSTAISGYAIGNYWSSTEISNTSAWPVYFPLAGTLQSGVKIQPQYVRAVRSF